MSRTFVISTCLAATLALALPAITLAAGPGRSLSAPARTLKLHHITSPSSPTCDTSWAQPVSGDWFDTSNWTNGVPDTIYAGGTPTASKSACITVPGTYTITVNGSCGGDETACPGQGDVWAAATSLTLGASSGTQTVLVEGGADKFAPPPQGHCTGAGSQPGQFFVIGTATIGTNGDLNLTEQGDKVDCTGAPIDQTSTLSVGTLINSGSFETEVGNGQPSNRVLIYGNITNAGGVIAINANTGYNIGNGSALTLDNAGQIKLSDGFYFGDSGANFMADTTVINDTGGSIANSGDADAGVFRVSEGNSFDQAGGSTLPAGPQVASPAVLIKGTSLNYTGSGPSSIVLECASSITGNIAKGQILIEETNGECGASSVTASTSFTNAGTIIQTEVNGQRCGSCTESFGVSGTLTNTGTLSFDPGTGPQINRFLGGNITNAGGRINVNTGTEYNNGNNSPLTLDNRGRISLADGALLGDLGGNGMDNTTIINDTGGSIVNSGDSNAGFVFVNAFGNNAFEQGAGTTTPSTADPVQAPVAVAGGTLTYTGRGASTIDLERSVTVDGNLGAQQNLVLQPVNGVCNPTGATPGDFTNAGTITFANNSVCDSDGGPGSAVNAQLNIGNGGTLTNTGTISSLVTHGCFINACGAGTINGNLSNQDAVSVDSGDQLTVNGNLTNSATVSTQADSKLTINGTYDQTFQGVWSTGIASPASLGQLQVNGTSALNGALILKAKHLNAAPGATLSPLSSGPRTGTFSAIQGTAIQGKRSLAISYAPSGFVLTAEATHLSVSPNSGKPGKSFTVTGSGFSAGETVAIHLGVRKLSPAIANSQGAITAQEKVPSLPTGKKVLSVAGRTSFVTLTTDFTVK